MGLAKGRARPEMHAWYLVFGIWYFACGERYTRRAGWLVEPSRADRAEVPLPSLQLASVTSRPVRYRIMGPTGTCVPVKSKKKKKKKKRSGAQGPSADEHNEEVCLEGTYAPD